MGALRYKKSLVFEYDGYEYFLFQVLNIGKKEDEFKFIFNKPHEHTGTIYFDNGFTIENSTILTTYGEVTYHKDGSLLNKFPRYEIESRKRINPAGVGVRRTPPNKIIDWEALFHYEIYDYRVCKMKDRLKKDKCVIDDFIFINRGQPFSCFINIVKDLSVVPEPSSNFERNIIFNNIGNDLHLWILLTIAERRGNYINVPEGIKIFSTNNRLRVMEKIEKK